MRMAPAATNPERGKPSASAREAFSGVKIWLDNWALRPCGQDTHSWAAKMETIRRLQNCRS